MLSSLSMLSIILCSSLMMVAASPVASPNPASLKVLSLPKGFDKSHPALNYKAIAENLNANPNYKVPQLPSEVQALAQTFEFDVSSDFVECTTNIFSPDVGSVNIAIDRLRTQGQTYCCHNGGGFSTRMISYGTAVLSISGTPGQCSLCSTVADLLRDVSKTCYQNLNGLRTSGTYRITYGPNNNIGVTIST